MMLGFEEIPQVEDPTRNTLEKISRWINEIEYAVIEDKKTEQAIREIFNTAETRMNTEGYDEGILNDLLQSLEEIQEEAQDRNDDTVTVLKKIQNEISQTIERFDNE